MLYCITLTVEKDYENVDDVNDQCKVLLEWNGQIHLIKKHRGSHNTSLIPLT